MNEEIDLVNKNLKETTNRIPKKFKKSEFLNYISKQSFQQLATIKIFNDDNIVFSDKIIPEKVMNDYISFNTLSKKKEKLMNAQQNFSDQLIISKDTFEEVYESMENIYNTKNSFIQYDSLNPYEESHTQDILERRKIFLRKSLKERHDHSSRIKNQNQQDVIQTQGDKNIEKYRIDSEQETIIPYQNQEDTTIIQENEDQQDILLTQKDENQNQQETESGQEIITPDQYQQDKDIPQKSEEEDQHEILTEKDNNVDQTEIEPEQEIIIPDQHQQNIGAIQENEKENQQEIFTKSDDNLDQIEIEQEQETIIPDQHQQNIDTVQENEKENQQEFLTEKDDNLDQTDIKSEQKTITPYQHQQDVKIIQKDEKKNLPEVNLEKGNQILSEFKSNLENDKHNHQKMDLSYKNTNQNQQENQKFSDFKLNSKNTNQNQQEKQENEFKPKNKKENHQHDKLNQEINDNLKFGDNNQEIKLPQIQKQIDSSFLNQNKRGQAENSIESNHSDFPFSITDNKQPKSEKLKNDKMDDSFSPKPLIPEPKEEEIQKDQISTENTFLDKYQFIIQNLDQFFKLLYKIGYGHFALLSKELKIENQKEEISFYSSTSAVIILFRLLREEDEYARYQNLILTLSNLFVRFNIDMIRTNKKNDENEFKIKEKKKFIKYNSFMKNSVEESIDNLEPFYIEYLKNIDVEDFLNVLEIRCAFDNWLLSNKNAKRLEIPFELLIPSKFSQYDLQISSCLIEHKDFSDEMKPRISDFAYLFTYLNIIDGLDKRIIINEWTKPEIEKIKATLLNFGSSSVSTLQFIAKTCIITKSLKSISSFVDKAVKLLHNESKTKAFIDDFDDEVLQKIIFNTNVYDSLKNALSTEKINEFNSKETEFIKLLLNNGILYFDDVFLDKKYNFKDIKFANFGEFVNYVANKIK